jgi:hypothetical protein
MTPCGELVGNGDDVGIDAVHRGSKHHRGNRVVGIRDVQIAIELAVFARADFDALPRHPCFGDKLAHILINTTGENKLIDVRFGALSELKSDIVTCPKKRH